MMDMENNIQYAEMQNNNNKTKSKKAIKTIFVLLLSIAILFVGLYGYWLLSRTADEKVIDRQLKGTTWTTDHIKVSFLSDYIVVDEEYLNENPGTLVQVKFHPILDEVTLVFHNGPVTVPFNVTDFNSVQLIDEDENFYNFTITYYEDKVLSVTSQYWTYFLSIK